jgi:hypothetical protein
LFNQTKMSVDVFCEQLTNLYCEREAVRDKEEELTNKINDYIFDVRKTNNFLWTLVSSKEDFSIESFFTEQEAINYCKNTDRKKCELFKEESDSIEVECIARMIVRYRERNIFLKTTVIILGLQKYRKDIVGKDAIGIIAKMIWASRFC